MNLLGIDVHTKDAKALVTKLNALSTTIDCSLGGIYREDPTLRQIEVLTSLTEDELDDYLYQYSGKLQYVGTYEISLDIQ